MKICLSFAGVAGNYPFHIGCAKKLIEKYDTEENEIIFAGTSSGSFVATLLALGYTPEYTIVLLRDLLKLFDKWYKNPITYWFLACEVFFNKLLKPEDYKKCNNRLHIGYSVITLKGLQPRVASTFNSNKDLLNAMSASARIFPYQKFPVYLYRNELALDGVFTRPLLRPNGYKVIGISSAMCYSNTLFSDIFPTTDFAHILRLYFKGQDFIERNPDYFNNIVHHEHTPHLYLKPYINPIERILNVIKFCIVVSFILYNRRRIMKLYGNVKKLLK